MLSKEIVKAASMLASKAIEVSNLTEADIFVEWAPHVNNISIRIFKTGWKIDTEEPDREDFDIRLESINAEGDILRALILINSIMEEA